MTKSASLDDGPDESRLHELRERKLRLECWRIALRIAMLLLAIFGASQVSGVV